MILMKSELKLRNNAPYNNATAGNAKVHKNEFLVLVLNIFKNIFSLFFKPALDLCMLYV